MSRTVRWLAVLFGTSVLVAAVACGWAWRSYQEFLQQALTIPEQGQVVELAAGAPAVSVIHQLQREGATRYDWRWRLLLRLEPGILRAGEYLLEPGLRPRDVLALLESGKVIQYRITIVEGWTFEQMLNALLQHPVLGPSADASELLEFARELTGQQNPEGWFLPETYMFTRAEQASDVMQRANAALQTELQSAWQRRQGDHPVASPEELLTLASIVEKETALDAERAEVAGVFVRRLQKGMRLQTDPTVIYGIGADFDGDIRRRDLETDTPYNTYTRFGLPPTPIALPGAASIRAAAQPAEGDSLYFVADGLGGHTFSRTLEEHNRAVQKMLSRKP